MSTYRKVVVKRLYILRYLECQDGLDHVYVWGSMTVVTVCVDTCTFGVVQSRSGRPYVRACLESRDGGTTTTVREHVPVWCDGFGTVS